MKRWLFNLTAAFSLLLSLTAATAWAVSYARPVGWHLLGIAHSADLTRAGHNARAVVIMVPVNRSEASGHGFWDAAWVLSQSGRLTLVAQTIDYDGRLRGVHASPASLIVDGRARVVASSRVPDSRGFAWDVDTQEGRGPVSVRVRTIRSPYWPIVLLGLLLPLLWVSRR